MDIVIGYIIKDTNNVTEEMWNDALCSKDTALHSLDDSKVLIKFESAQVPLSFAGESILTKAEAKATLSGGEWTNDI